MARSLKETRAPEQSPDYRMRSLGTVGPGARGTNTDPSVEELSRASQAARGPLTRGDGDATSSLNEQASRNHARPGSYRARGTEDGRII